MRVSDFDFELPEERIALRPASPRDAAKLLVVRAGGALEHAQVRDLPRFLEPGDAIVVNDTKVIPARLTAQRLPRETGAGARIELTLIAPLGERGFRAFVRPAKRVKPGDVLRIGEALEATVAARDGGEVELNFAVGGPALEAALAAAGDMPLPPYIASRRKPDARDARDYQTIYAAHSGSVAAPTAGLHFTPELFAALEARSIARATVTLHVGPGTFLPVTAENTEDHRMHAEWATLSAETAAQLNAVRARGGRIVAVGSTATRTLERATDESGIVHPFTGAIDLFITPGYRFRSVDAMLTNFHLPRSTLFMLVSAFCGLETMKTAYREAIARGYRFYSYGDACLLFRGAA
jgi:S-adenosylmethionine:tRNA ribosyltransferase-isomerase